MEDDFGLVSLEDYYFLLDKSWDRFRKGTQNEQKDSFGKSLQQKLNEKEKTDDNL